MSRKLVLGSLVSSALGVGMFVALDGCGTATDTTSTSCTLTSNTTEGATSTNGCALLTRDVSSCKTSREAAGLSGFWLKFSCRVTLTKSGTNVIITTDSQPDYKSAYFATSNACYSAGFPTGRAANPNSIGAQSISMTVPMTPTSTTAPAMAMGVIGIAINGVSIYSTEAAPGDNIYTEVSTFDKCEGHPAGTRYHYHTEPTTATNSDSNFIGVMMDGYPIYGRYDSGSTTLPTLNLATYTPATTISTSTVSGGHSGTTVDSPSVAVKHYHVNPQTNGTSSAYFITSGAFIGAPGTCTGCQ